MKKLENVAANMYFCSDKIAKNMARYYIREVSH